MKNKYYETRVIVMGNKFYPQYNKIYINIFNISKWTFFRGSAKVVITNHIILSMNLKCILIL